MRKQYSKILIVRFSSIGDIVLCTPVIRNVKKQLGVEVHFLTKTRYRQLLSHNPYVDKLWTFEKEIDEIIAPLKETQFDLVIDLHKNLRSFRLKKSLGIDTISFDKINVEKWLMVHLKIDRLPDKHLIDRYMDSISKLGIQDDGLGMDFFYNTTLEKENDQLGLTQKYIVIVLGATYFTKRVPVHLIEQILSDFPNQKFVLIGGKDVEDLGNSLTDTYSNVINVAGKLSLQSSAAIIDRSAMVISGDTGMMHIAAALQKPIVSIWGSTFLGFGMYPYYGNANPNKNISIEVAGLNCRPCSKIGKDSCPKSHFDCMMKIDYSRLKAAIDRQLLHS